MGYKYLRKVKNSPKFGKLLPIDHNPYQLRLIRTYPAEDIYFEIKTYIVNSGSPDYIWLKGPGDFSLYSGLRRLIKLIHLEYPDQKIGLYANSILFQRKDVRDDLQGCDLLAINLNSMVESNFSKVCACNEPVKLKDVKEGIKEFAKEFKGYLFIYTIFLKGVNDTFENVRELKEFMIEIRPDSFSIGEYIEGRFESISQEFKYYIKKSFQDVPFDISYKF
ncbi:MAG: hypothetical protein ACTSV5_01835 [Promethearchaeota archaeon]